MLTIGIICGLAAATSQSMSYLLLRMYTTSAQEQGGGTMQLLVLAHTMQAVVCLPLLWMLWPNGLTVNWSWIWPILLGNAGYLFAQTCLFTAVRYTPASRVSPLLGIKIAVLAALTVLILGDSIYPLQWIGAVLAIVAAFVLNYTGGSIPMPAVIAVLLACAGYSTSDFNIRLLLDALARNVGQGQASTFHLSLFGFTLMYVTCGMTVIPLLPKFGSKNPVQWRRACPFAFAWLLAMVFLFVCYAYAGVVLGGIVQSTRGLISIGLGALLAAQGLVHLESHVSRAIFWRRIAAAGLMMLAVGLFIAGKR